MKILVAAKRVVDANVRVRVKADHSNVEIEHSKMSLNPFDENAIEEAVRLKEQGIATEVVVLSIGGGKNEDVLRTALARGCDRAILVESDEVFEPINIAQIFTKIVEREQPQVVLLGKQAIDDDANQVPQMLAGKLNWAQATNISKLNVADGELVVTREIDGGSETLQLSLPAVLSADLTLNEPRFIKLPQLMQAKKKPLEKINFAELGLGLTARSRLLNVVDGEVKKQCQFVTSVAELAALVQKHRGSHE